MTNYTLKTQVSKAVWEKEVVDGTDPAGTRRPFPGKVINFRWTENHKQDESDPIGNQVQVIESLQKTLESYTIEMDLYLREGYDVSDLDANFLPLIFGTAPAGGLVSHNSKTPLESCIVEIATADTTNPEYYLFEGCKGKTWSLGPRVSERTVVKITLMARKLTRGIAEVTCSTTSLSAVVEKTAPYVLHKDFTFFWSFKGTTYLLPYGTRFPHGGATGTFEVGEIITGTTPGDTAKVVFVDPGDAFLIVKEVAGTFSSELVTGAKSGATATVTTPVLPTGTFEVGEGLTETGGGTDGTATVLAVGDDYLIVTLITGDFNDADSIANGVSSSATAPVGQTQTISAAKVREFDIAFERNHEEIYAFTQTFTPDCLIEHEFAVTWTVKFIREHNQFYTIFHNDPALSAGKVGLKMVIDQTNVVSDGFYMSADLGFDTVALFNGMTEHDLDLSAKFQERGFSGKLAGGNPVIDFVA